MIDDAATRHGHRTPQGWVDALASRPGEAEWWETAKQFQHGPALPVAVVGEMLDDLVHGAPTERRAVAAWTLGFATIRRRHVEAVIDRLFLVATDRSAPADVRGHAVEAIGHQLQCSPAIGLRRRSARRLDALARDPEPDVRYWTMFALGVLSAGRSQRLLRRALDDPDERVRTEAADALGAWR